MAKIKKDSEETSSHTFTENIKAKFQKKLWCCEIRSSFG